MAFRAVMIGVGGIAHGKYLPALKAMPDVELVAFCDVDGARAQEAAALYGAPGALFTDDYTAALAVEADAAFVLTPNRTHADITIAALASGKHVMCEKPMATTSADAERMLAAAEAAGKLLTVGYQNRFRPDFQYVRALVEDGALGDIYFARALALRRRGVPTWGAFLSRELQGGGPLIDIGTHVVDLALWLMNNHEPETVLGTCHRALGARGSPANRWGPWNPAAYTVEDAAFALVRMVNGATLLIEASWALNTAYEADPALSLAGTAGGVDTWQRLTVTEERAGRLVTVTPELPGSEEGAWEVACRANVENFVGAVLGRNPLLVTAQQAAVVTRLLEAVYASAETGRAVTLTGPAARPVPAEA